MNKKRAPITKVCSAVLVSLTLTLPGLCAAAGQGKSPQPPFDIEQFKPSKENVALYGDYRRKWNRLSGFELSSLHWNQFVAVFINQSEDVYRNNYLEYLKSSQDEWDDEDEDEEEEGEVVSNFKSYPVGTIVAKEGFDSSAGKPGDATFISIMKKQAAGYDPKNGDWRYMKYTATGQKLLDGKASDPNINAQCGACHINVADRDYVFSTFYTGKATK